MNSSLVLISLLLGSLASGVAVYLGTGQILDRRRAADTKHDEEVAAQAVKEDRQRQEREELQQMRQFYEDEMRKRSGGEAS